MPPGYRILHITYAVAPIVLGLDKFFHLLVDWNKYLAPVIRRRLPVTGDTFMDLVGVVEILVGVLVWFMPRYGGYVVAGWLWAVVTNLLLIPGYFDIAARDLVLSMGGLALARQSGAARRTAG